MALVRGKALVDRVSSHWAWPARGRGRIVLFGLVLAVAAAQARAETASWRSQVEEDWEKQAEASSMGCILGQSVPTWGDAAGAVDGVKNGRYAFHTGQQPNPWWQVDLGRPEAIARIVVYNRLDYPPGLHNADNVIVLTSDDGKKWVSRYRNEGKHFGGIRGAAPLEVCFQPGVVRARYVRLRIPSAAPIFFHLDEVEVYGPADGKKNLALGCVADQSSVSQWSTAKPGAVSPRKMRYPVEEVLERGRRLAADLERSGVETKGYCGELAGVASRLAGLAPEGTREARRALYMEARWVVRRLVFANPLLGFDELVLVKRFTQETYPDVCLNHMPWVSRPGGDICVVKLAGAEGEPECRELLQGRLGPGHVHGMDLWWDANRVVFGYARSKTEEPPAGWLNRAENYRLRATVEPTHLFEVGIDGNGLRQLTGDTFWSDLDPTYLPSGEIAFVSERSGYSLQCNEYDKDETSCNLFVMGEDGSNIRRLSASKDGDYLPHCLEDGRIGYTRWEYQERGWAHIQSIWVIRPDGTGADALFKQHINNPWAIEEARSIPGADDSRLVAIATGHHTLPAGPVIVVRPGMGMNNPAGIRIVTPEVSPPEGGMSGTPVAEGGVRDGTGLYMTPWPLSEKYFLASYTYSDKQTDAAGYGIYLIDVFGNKELIYRDASISCSVPIPLVGRPRPPVLPSLGEPAQSYAVCCAADVSYGVEGVEPGRARYLRISQRLPWPYGKESGGQRYTEKASPNNWTPVRILGEVPLEADGSAHFKVPADTAIYFQLLDAEHMELRRMRSFISFQPGERRACVGCHESRAEAPVDVPFPLAALKAPVVPRPPRWGDRPLSFLRDVQPIFDRHCVKCHGGLKPAGGLDFGGGLTSGPAFVLGSAKPIGGYGHNRAFDTIIAHKLVAWSPVQGDAAVTRPLEFGSHRSKLVEVLREGACGRRAKLSEDEWLRLVTWIDANAPYHDRFVNKRAKTPAYSLPDDGELLKGLTAIHARRCGECHPAEEITRADWIDIHRPEKSLFLAAPLAKAAGGRGACGPEVYASRKDADYRAALGLVEAAVAKVWRFPRRDVKSLAESGEVARRTR